MYSVLCPTCHFVNPAGATCCRACNADFFVDSDHSALDPAVTATLKQRRGLSSLLSEAMPLDDEPPRRRASDHEAPPSEAASDGAETAPLARPARTPPAPAAPITLIDPVLPAAPAEAEGRSPLGASLAEPTVWPDLPGAPARAPEATQRSDGPLEPLRTGPDRRLVTKAMARQAARRARMAALAADTAQPAPVDVLVLDGDDATRAELVRLLGRFGFHVHEALDVRQAERFAELAPFAAAFLDIRLDDSDGGAGIALCERLHRPVRGGPSTAVVLMSPRLRPADRVRAALARSDAVLAKPLSRGDVARTLESCGVALPADERRH